MLSLHHVAGFPRSQHIFEKQQINHEWLINRGKVQICEIQGRVRTEDIAEADK